MGAGVFYSYPENYEYYGNNELESAFSEGFLDFYLAFLQQCGF